MLRKFLLINLILVLAWQPVGIAFASSDFLLSGHSTFGTQLAEMVNCELMDRSECANFESCSMQGHLSCDLKNQLAQSVLIKFYDQDTSLSTGRLERGYHSIRSDVLLRPPRIS